MRNAFKDNIIKRAYQGLFLSSRSFTLIEILIAIMVIAIGIFSVIAISGKSYATISLQKNKLIALNLAREELDIIRNIRDENWLTEDGCDGQVDFCIPSDLNPDRAHRRTAEGNLDVNGVPEDNCDWRCGLGENLLDVDYLGDVLTLIDPVNQGDCTVGTGCPLEASVCPQTTARCPLYIDGEGRYQHTGSTITPSFFRNVFIEHNNDLNGDGNDHNDFSVLVTICWQERGGRWHGVCLEDHLYNWAH